ncbi:MAG: NADPH:quinone oxidoreductase family protein [Candidatus Hydrogenedentes bacterium]|nr:NADPH:quinone oxidoreductase family protein [Candidatus Hydrogenedentota bacterium]
MRAWVVNQFGPYKTALQLAQADAPEAEGESAVIDVKAAGVMYADLLNISGNYQMKAPLPFVPGSEAAGVVSESGKTSRFKVGDRVVTVNLMGAFAEHMLALDQVSYAIPDAMSFAEAAAFTINYQTSYFALVHRAQLKPGEWVLVHGGAGGVGTASIQLALALGANVIATAGADDKAALCKQCGAHHAINYRTGDFVAAVKDITQGRGADVIIDPVGGDVFDSSTKCVAFEGRLIVIGFAAGRIPTIAANRMLVKNFGVLGLFWGAYQTRNPALVVETQDILYGLYNDGKIKPVVSREYPLEELPDALESIETRKCLGKPVLIL